jgi:hypothetical protein
MIIHTILFVELEDMGFGLSAPDQLKEYLTILNQSQTNVIGSHDNQVQNQHKKHKHDSTGYSIQQIISQSKQHLSVGDIPFP